MARRRPAKGQVIGGFTLLERIHDGEMSTVWMVRREGAEGHGEEDFPMAMKIPRLGYGDDPVSIVGFEVEQMILPRLTGPHVPRYVAGADFSEQAFIVTEFVQGEPLGALAEGAPLPAEQVADIGARVATALHDLHRQHVIHLDVKPANVIFRPGGAAVLIDYGLSRHDQLPDFLAEEFRIPMGTGAYMAPEQVLGSRDDPRSDIFALGAVLYRLATGRFPFGTPASVGGLRRRLYRDPVPPRAIVPRCPAWLQEVILRCLEVDPDARYDTAAQLALMLRNPGQVVLTDRAERSGRDGRVAVLRRWFRAIGADAPARRTAAAQLSAAPFVAVAVDVGNAAGALLEAQRRSVLGLVRATPGARLACLAVLKTARFGMDMNVDAEGNNLHVKVLLALRQWAQPMGLPQDSVTFHVLEAPDPAAAIVDYAAANHVDHLIVGARGHSAVRRYLGSVSSQVVAQAPCTVTVVRAAEAPAVPVPAGGDGGMSVP
ncbi:bifunctional serine/threonine-protein kinase/universal stress protein [Arenibaculum pallidiluteum]|uniref:bifunctional serine/threonine-protein kinase/universal stress protein n=1 Tax=Arenibaculum pallidiluteum TaxID=2812559 RepID=UPI001A96A1E8|nr:bifunctional serine/threonine-protein kinase/universal stress protein [Arenibaculum pallidiluteum]